MMNKSRLVGLLVLLALALFVQCDDDVNQDVRANSSGEIVEYEVLATGLQLEHEIVNEQADQPSSGEQFIAFHRDVTLGDKEVLSPTLLGLNTMAMKFLPNHLKLLTIVSATREIVAGVMYELLVNALDQAGGGGGGDGERTVCHLEILEKPWIVNTWGEKLKVLKATNCTGEGVQIDAEDSHQQAINPLFVRPTDQKLTEDRIRDLERQIIMTHRKRVENPSFTSTTETVTGYGTPPPPPPTTGLDANVQSALDKFFSVESENRRKDLAESEANPAQSTVPSTTDTVFAAATSEPVLRAESTTPSSALNNLYYNANAEANVVQPQSNPEIVGIAMGSNTNDDDENNNQQIIVPFFDSVTPDSDNQRQVPIDIEAQANLPSANRRRRRREVTFTEEEKIKYLSFANQALIDIDSLDADDHRRVAFKLGLVKELSSDFACKTYLIRAQTADSQCSEGMEEDYRACLGKLLIPGTMKLCTLEVSDCAQKGFQFKKGGCSPINRQRKRRAQPGGLQDLDVKDPIVEKVVSAGLSKLTGADGGAALTLVGVTRAQKQVVAGELYHIDVTLKDGESEATKCELKVWYQRWISADPIEVTGKCDNKKKYAHKRVARHTRAMKMTGKPLEITNPENDVTVQAYVQDALALYNGVMTESNHTVQEIKRATVQVVSGTLHKIEVMLKNESEQKSCKISVWTRPWVAKGKMTTVLCDGEEELQSRSKRSVKPLLDENDENERHPHENERAKAQLHELLFKQFQEMYNKRYHSTIEKNLRYKTFRQNLDRIEELGEQERGTAKYGMTQFTDMTPNEFKRYTGLLPRLKHENAISNPMATIPDIELPKSFDWRDKGVISEVKNQGSCGSCWAFSVVGNVEGLNAIKTGNLSEFSEQELVDCDTLDSGCNGGLPDNAYKAIERIGGLEYESEYPYVAHKNKQCGFNASMSHVRVNGAIDFPKNETQMAQWLVQNGPISIGLNAAAMQFYRAGISHPHRFLCRPGKLDHGVLIVGFGVAEYPLFNKSLPYWIVKNSWGPTWGEKGYYRIFRGDNTCGISEMASSAVLE